MNIPPQCPPPSTFPSVLGWFMILAGGLGVPASILFLLILMGKSYATQHPDVIFCSVMLLGPATMLITGIGMLKRSSWAKSVTLAGLTLMLLGGGWQLIKKPHPANTYLDENGQMTTYTGAGAKLVPMLIMGVCTVIMIKLLSRGVSGAFSSAMVPALPASGQPASPRTDNDHCTWRVGHRGRDAMYYEEKINGQWLRLDIDGEMLMGPAHHVIYFHSAERWQSHPEWARHRRPEIIFRIKSEYRKTDYEYEGDA